MSTSAQLKPVQDTMFKHSGGSRSALARQFSQPLESPVPTTDERRLRELIKLQKRKAAHLAVVQCTAAAALAAGFVGAVFLGGHVELAKQAQRSVIVSEMLGQQLERSRVLGNEQARDVTPTTINQKAGQIGMARPDDRDTVVIP